MNTTALEVRADNGAALSDAALVLDSLTAGYALANRDGTTGSVAPLGSYYKIAGPISSGGTVSVTLQFTNSGVLGLTYIPRVLEGSPR